MHIGGWGLEMVDDNADPSQLVSTRDGGVG